MSTGNRSIWVRRRLHDNVLIRIVRLSVTWMPLPQHSVQSTSVLRMSDSQQSWFFSRPSIPNCPKQPSPSRYSYASLLIHQTNKQRHYLATTGRREPQHHPHNHSSCLTSSSTSSTKDSSTLLFHLTTPKPPIQHQPKQP